MPLDTGTLPETLPEKAAPTLSVSISQQDELRGRIEDILQGSYEYALRELLLKYESEFKEKIKTSDLETLKKAWKVYLGGHPIGDVREFLRSLSLPSIEPLVSKLREKLLPLLEKEDFFRRERARIGFLFQSIDLEKYRSLLREYEEYGTPLLEKKIREALREEIEDTLSKLETYPRFQRKFVQSVLEKGVTSFYDKTGIRLGLVSIGGSKGEDVGIFGKMDSRPETVLFRESGMHMGDNPETVLDQTRNPVFIHYLVALDGGILGVIETARSREFREVIFPEREMISRTPRGSHFEWQVTGTKKVFTLKKKEANGFFIALKGTKSMYPGMEGEGSLVTLGWEVQGSGHVFDIFVSSSLYTFTDRELGQVRSVSAGTNGKMTLYNGGGLSVDFSKSGWLGMQYDTKEGPSKPQTAELNGSMGLDIAYQYSRRTEFSGSYSHHSQWAPNIFPNTFDRIPLRERQLMNFLSGDTVRLGVSHILSGGWKVEFAGTHDRGPLSQKTSKELRVGSPSVQISAIVQKTKSSHPFISDGKSREVGLTLGTQGKSQVGLRYTQNICPQKDELTSLRIDIPFR